MSETESEGFFDDLGDMYDSGVSAAENLGGAAVDFGAGVIDQMQTGAQVILGGVDYALGDEAGGDAHFEAADQNVEEMYENYDQAYEQIF